MMFVCPMQCHAMESANRLLRSIISDPTNPIDDVQFVKVGQSMSGGGGPACLRLRVPADERTRSQLPYEGLLNESLYESLTRAVERHYPENVSLSSFCDERFVEHLSEVEMALQQAYWMSSYENR
jgi:succinylarginine dihydrolase